MSMSANNSALVEITGNPTTDPTGNCRHLERGRILYFPIIPYGISEDDREFLLGQQQTGSRFHKNISFRPATDVLNGMDADSADRQRTHQIMQRFSNSVAEFVQTALAPYHGKLKMDYASFRPFEEEDRDLPLHKRNDLLHVDAFPTRPTRGSRILRVFANLNLTKPRVWNTTESFETLAKQYAEDAGLRQIAEDNSYLSRAVQSVAEKLGFSKSGRTAYDVFMLRFHDYLKENREFQQNCPKIKMEFPPLATWVVFTDGVAHAAMSGQFAIEQTLLIPPSALVTPQEAPYRILEKLVSLPLVS